MSKHTPGPWDCDEGDFTIYQLETFEPINFKEEANARLISAAPELLEALEVVLELAVSDRFDDNRYADAVAKAVNLAGAAIAKAKGE